jgi:HEPN domain-containing protein
VDTAEYLSEYAIEARYPSKLDELSDKDWKEAVKIAKQVFEWAEKIIEDIKTKG